MRDAPVHVLGVYFIAFAPRQLSPEKDSLDACPFLLLGSLQLAGAVLHSALSCVAHPYALVRSALSAPQSRHRNIASMNAAAEFITAAVSKGRLL